MKSTLIGLALLLAACSDVKKGFDEGFRKAFQKKFVESCVDGAKKAGTPEERLPKVTEVCTCVATGLVAKHTPAELTAMDEKSNEAEIKVLMQGCLPQ